MLLAIGGWNEGSFNYSELAAHPDRRQRFVKQSSEFVRLHKFDGLLLFISKRPKAYLICLSLGLDIDWEYPTQRGGKPQDKETFVLLVKELSQEFRKHNLHLSSAFGAAKKTIDSAYSVHNLARTCYLEFIYLLVE